MYNIYPVSLITNKQPSCDLLRFTRRCLLELESRKPVWIFGRALERGRGLNADISLLRCPVSPLDGANSHKCLYGREKESEPE